MLKALFDDFLLNLLSQTSNRGGLHESKTLFLQLFATLFTVVYSQSISVYLFVIYLYFHIVKFLYYSKVYYSHLTLHELFIVFTSIYQKCRVYYKLKKKFLTQLIATFQVKFSWLLTLYKTSYNFGNVLWWQEAEGIYDRKL